MAISQADRGPRAWANRFAWAVFFAGAIAIALSVAWVRSDPIDVLAFAVLAIGTLLSQPFAVVTSRGARYEMTPVFAFAAILLLPVAAAVSIVLVAIIAEWVRHRGHLQTMLFNVGNLAISFVLTSLAYTMAIGRLPGAASEPIGLAGAFVAIIVFALTSRSLTVAMLLLRDSHTRLSEVLDSDLLLTDAALFCTGAAFAALWQVRPLLVLLVLFPLLLTYRALRIPLLREQADTDPKTGLKNARYLGSALHTEMQRAIRFGRPLAVVMADLDLLRDVNNRYGHLAGDIVISSVAEILARATREFDVAARFGGEEFMLVLPECDSNQGLAVAERIRQTVDAARIAVPTSAEPLRITISLGVAAYPEHGGTADELEHYADLAMYRAKSLGRNRVCVSTSLAATSEELADQG